MKRLMNYLTTFKHRVVAAIILTILLAVSYNAMAQEPDHPVRYVEPSMYVQFGTEGEQGDAMCLKTGPSQDDAALPEGWISVTCNDINTPVQWHLCYINADKKSFICGVKPS